MNNAIVFKKESILGKTRLKYTFSKLANYITFFGNVIQDTSSVETGQLRLKKRTTNSKFKLDGKGNISLQGNINTSNI
jgi:hypothetical protein